MPTISAKTRKHRKKPKQEKKTLDTLLEKRERGRPFKIKASWVRGRADNYRRTLDTVWDRVAPRLLTAQTREDIVRSFEGADVGGYALELMIAADLILEVPRDTRFPKRNRDAQINFLADSIAGQGVITPRSSRDICERERARIKRAHQIIRYEFWIECSCGYRGRSLNQACPRCEAEISLMRESPLDASSVFQALARNVRT